MALASVATALLLAFLLARVELSATHVLKGKISCLDCNSVYDLSGIMVLSKCDKVGKLVLATAEKDGSFETELPSAASHCMAKLAGGPNQLYASRNNMISKIIKANDGSDAYTISTPLAFSTACHSITTEAQKCKATISKFGSSKTVDLPLPPEWGLAPSSYYVPFFPIIGVP